MCDKNVDIKCQIQNFAQCLEEQRSWKGGYQRRSIITQPCSRYVIIRFTSNFVCDKNVDIKCQIQNFAHCLEEQRSWKGGYQIPPMAFEGI